MRPALTAVQMIPDDGTGSKKPKEKWTVSKISSDPPFKDYIARFTTVPLNP